MVILNLLLFLIFLIILLKSADYAVLFSTRISRSLKFPEFMVSFFIVAFISVLPESTISIISAIKGEPGLGLGTLIGSNIADLTIVFGIVSLFSRTGIKVKSTILSNNLIYLILVLFPLLLGFDGYFSQVDGAILVLVGLLFYYKLFKDRNKFKRKLNNNQNHPFFKSLIFLIVSLTVIIFSAYLTVKYSVNFAYDLKIPAIFIGSTIIALGTCLPELIFSIKAVRKNRDSLALGDLLGTVITDATIIFGIVCLISPFSYNIFSIYLLCGGMFLAGISVMFFMKTGKILTKNEGALLIFAYIIYLFLEFFINIFR